MAVTNQTDLPKLNTGTEPPELLGVDNTPKLIGTDNDPIRSYGDDPFSNFAEGFVIGGRGLIANTNYLLSQLVDDPIDKYNMEKWSNDVINNSPDSDGSVGQWIGQLVPSVLPTAGAVVTSMIPGAQPLAGALGTIGLGSLALSSAGGGLKQYDDDKRSAGLDPYENPGERFAVASIYGATEYIFEKIALDKYLPKSITSKLKEPIGKLISQGNKIEPKVANRVVAEFIKKKPGSLANYRDVALTEGITEALTSFSQDLSDTYFLENKPTWEQIGKNMMESFGAGVLMGVGVGSLSFKSQDLATKRRREAQGDVYITTHDGATKEIVGKSGEKNVKFDLLEADGKITSVNENEIGEVFSISNKQFDNILKAKDFDGVINDEIYTVNKNIQLENERVSIQELEKFADSKGALFNQEGKRTYNVITVKDRNYIVTKKDKNNPKIVYGFDIDAFSLLGQDTPMVPINIDNAEAKTKTWTENEMQTFFKEAQKENVIQELGTPNAVKGETIMYQGEIHDVLGTFEGVVNLKNRESGEDIQIDKRTYSDIKSTQQDINPAKKSKDDIPINDDGTIGAKPSGDQATKDLPTFNIGRAKYKVSEMNDKTSEMVIGKTYTVEDTANKVAEDLAKNYGNLDFEVVNETDTNDITAKNKFVIKAKPKGKKPVPVKKPVKARQKKESETQKPTKKPVKKTKTKPSETKPKSRETKKKPVIKKKPVKGRITKKGDTKMSKEFLDRLPYYDPLADSGMEFTRQIDPYIKGNVKRVEAVIKRLTGTWRKAPKVKVYESFMDYVPNNGINNPLEYVNTNAFFDPDTNQIVFFANQFLGKPNSVIEKKLYHEAVGHQGLKGLLPTKDFNTLMDGVYNDIILKNNDKLSNNIAFTYIHRRYNPSLEFDPKVNYLEINRPDGKPMSLAETREIAEEYIAHKIEDPKFSKSANNLAGSFKDAISSLTGKEFTISNNDIKRIINSATQYIERDGKLYNKNIIKYSLSNKYNVPDQEVLNKVRESRNLKRGDNSDYGKYRPELDRSVNKIGQDEFEAIVKGKVIEPALYDVLTTGDTKLYNPIFGYDVDMKGLKGGPNNLFLKENIKHNIAVSYTKLDKAVNMLKRINIKKVDYITYVLTGTGSNLTANIDFRKAMFGKGGFVSKIPLRDFTEFRDDFINRAKGSTKDVNIDKEIEQLSKFKSLSKFSETIMDIPFDKFQLMANKVFPETVGTPKTNIMQTKYGLPTRDAIIGALADPMFANAQGGDIVSLSKPDPTTLYINETEYNALAKAEIKKYEDMGYKVLVTPKEAEHPSYPYAIGGEAIGVLDQFQNYADIYTKLDKNKKRVPIKDRIDNPNFNIGRRSNTLIDKFNVYKKTNRGPSENPFVTQKVSVAPFRYFQDYMSDIVKDKEIKPSDVVAIMNKRDFSSYRKAIVDTGKLFNLKVGNLVNNVGVYANEVEYSNSIDVIGKKEDIKAYAVAMATIKEKQREVIVSEEVDQSNDVNVNITFNKNVDIDKIIEKAKDFGFDGLSFDINQNKMTIFGVQLDGNLVGDKFRKFYLNIINEVKAVQHQKVQNEFIQEKDYAGILEQYRIKGYNETRSDLNQFISNLTVNQKPLDNIQETEIRQSQNLNYREDYQNNLHSEIISYLQKHPQETLPARSWLNKLFGNTDLTVQDLKWMGIYNIMMQKNKKFNKDQVYDIISKTKYKTLDLNPDSQVKDLLVTTQYNDKVNTRADQSFTKFPVVADIQTKIIRNGEYEIMFINKIKGNEEVAIKELIKKSNYNDIFAIAYENKQVLNGIKTKYDFASIIDKVKLKGKEYGLLIISPKLKEQSRGDMGLRYSQNLPRGFDDNAFIINQEYMRYYMQDKMIYLKRLQEYAESKGIKVTDENNAYVKENLAKGKVQEKTDRFKETYFKPLIQHVTSITKQGRVEYKEISDYVYGLHAKERRKYVDPGITVAEQERYISNGESKISVRDRNKLINMIKEITRFNVQQAYNYGLMTKQNFNKFMPRKGKSKTAMFDFYVPLRGFEKSEFDNTAFSYVNMKAKGRGGFKADDPLAYMYIMAQSTIIQGEKNNTKKALLNFVRQFPNPNLYEIKNMYFEVGDNKIQETDIKPTGDYKFALDPFQDAEAKAIRRFEGKESDLVVFEEGKKKVITFIGETGKRLVEGFGGKKINNEGIAGKLFYGADAISQIMRKTFTQYSPEFIPINFIRDITSGYINIRNDFGGKVANEILSDVGQSFKTLKQYYGSKTKTLPKGDEGTYLAQFIENGSKTGWSQLKTVDEIKQEIDDYAKSLETANKTTFKTIVKKPLEIMDTINSVLENTVRFAAFKKLLKMGKSLDEASMYAKDLTVNFNRKGYYGNVLNSLYLFYNAGIQGVERLTRPLFDKKTRYRTATNYFLALPMIGLISQMLSRIITGEDEEQDKYYYDLLPEYTRTHNLVLPNPLVLFKSEEELKNMNTRDRFITIPLPYGHNVFMASPDHMTRAVLGVESPSEAFLNTMFTGVESFSPLGPISNEGRDDQGFIRYVTPTVLTPFRDLSQNRNFAGSPIYREDSPYSKTDTPSSQRYFNSVNPVIRTATDFLHNATGGTSVESGVIEINPEIPEFLLTSYFGGVASLVINTGTLAIHNGKEIMGIETPKKDGDLVIGNYNVGPLRKLPFVRRFLTEVSDFSASEDYYNYKEEIDNVVGLKKKYQKGIQEGTSTRDEYRTFLNNPKNKELLRLENVLKSYDKQIKNLRDIRDSHRADGNEIKEEQIQRKINQLYKKFNKFVNVKELRTLDDIMSFIQE